MSHAQVSEEVPVTDTPDTETRVDSTLLWLIGIVAVVLRMLHLGDEDAGFEEISTLLYLNEPTLGAFMHEVQTHNPPVQPLFPSLEYFWAHWIGSSDLSLRILALIPGLISIYLVYVLGSELRSRRVGLLAAFLLATSHIHIYYSQEIRMYAMTVCVAILSLLFLLRIVQSGKPIWYAAHFLSTVVLVWTHLLGAFVLPCEAVFLLWCFRRERFGAFLLWCGLQIVAVFTLLPWFLSMDYGYIEEQYVWMELPTIFFREAGVQNLSIQGLYQHWLTRDILVDVSSGSRAGLSFANGTMIAASLMSVVVLVMKFFRPGNDSNEGEQRVRRGFALLQLSLFLGPVLIMYTVSHLWQPSFFDRYVLISLVGMYLVMATAIDMVPNTWLRRGVCALLVGIVSVQAFYWASGPTRRPWSTVAHRVSQEPYSRVMVHTIGNDMHLMYTVSSYHVKDERCKLVPYKDFAALEEYLLGSYAEGRPEDKTSLDVIVPVTAEAAVEVAAYLEEHAIRHESYYLNSRSPLTYIRILGHPRS